MEQFDAGSGMSSANLHTAIFVVICAVCLMWGGWVIVRSYKLYSRNRLDETAFLMTTVQALAIVILITALVLVM